jgi:hypothetical protein
MRKLPVIAALSHAIKSTVDNIGFAFHISWPWMVLLLPLNIITNIYLGLNTMHDPFQDPAQLYTENFGFVIPLAIASIIAYSSIAVNWHRYVLLDEVAEGWNRLRIDGLMWRYIGNVFLIVLILAAGIAAAALVMVLVGFLLSLIMGEASLIIIVPVSIALYAYAIVAMYRLMVKLPGVALDRRDFGMRDAWRVTTGNSWQILGLLLLFFGCLLVLGLGLLLVTYLLGLAGTVGLSISIAIQVMINWVTTILGVTLLTSLYGFFVEEREF